jgi:hypothetical protein
VVETHQLVESREEVNQIAAPFEMQHVNRSHEPGFLPAVIKPVSD